MPSGISRKKGHKKCTNVVTYNTNGTCRVEDLQTEAHKQDHTDHHLHVSVPFLPVGSVLRAKQLENGSVKHKPKRSRGASSALQTEKERLSCEIATTPPCLSVKKQRPTSLPAIPVHRVQSRSVQSFCKRMSEPTKSRSRCDSASTTSCQSAPKKDTKKTVSLLTAIKPENERSEKERFLLAKYKYNPLFIYRNPADPIVLERFGVPSDKYLQVAILVMGKALQQHGHYENFEVQTGGRILNRPEIVSIVRRYLRQEDLEDEIRLNLSEDLLSRASMTKVKGQPTLNVRIVNLRQGWVEGLLRHEIGTHYLRSCNNKNQIWYNWKKRRELEMRPFNPTEEGLASLHSVLLRDDPSLWRSALLYYTAYQAAYLPFKELFNDLGKFVKDPHVRWDYCMRAKRGQRDTSEIGGFCKDQVYLEGAVELLKHRRTIDFRKLVSLGKVAYQDVDRLDELADFSETRIPRFLRDYQYYLRCLDKVAQCNGLTEEILASV